MPEQRHEEDPERVVIRDRRRIDPTTGQVRPPDAATGRPDSAGPAGMGPGGVGAAAAAGQAGAAARAQADAAVAGGQADTALIDELRTELAEREREIGERTEDLQRLQAQFVNYRKRVDRDIAQAGQLGVASLVTEILPILDDIERARAHGDLGGGFKAVAEALEGVVSKAGAESFGEVGDLFDPTIHEAVTHSMSADVAETVCAAVMRRGYRLGDRLLRPAMVAVAEPEHPLPTITHHEPGGQASGQSRPGEGS